MDNCTTVFLIPILEKLYAKVDKSRKSRISSSDETTLLTSVVVNGGPTLSVHNEDDPNDTVPETAHLDPDEAAFVDNDLYEKDSDQNSTTDPLTVSNYPVDDDETYEIPEDVVNQLEHGTSSQLLPPTPPVRTTSSPRNSTYFEATPPVPTRHSSLALTSFTPPLPLRQSLLLSTPRRPASKSIDVLDREDTPKLPPRLSLMLPTRTKSVSPEPKRATFTGHFVPMPLGKPRTSDTTSESELDSSSESDFEELPPPREHAPPLPEGAEAAPQNRVNKNTENGMPDASESEYLEPISLRQNDGEGKEDDNHDYDPVYVPSNPGASHIAHLVDNTNYLKGARNRSPSKASINPYEEIQFGTEVYADVDESTMTSPLSQTPSPAPPRLTPRSSRLSDLVTPPELSPRSPGASSNTSQLSPGPPSTSGSTPQLPPRSPSIKGNGGGPGFTQQNGRPLRLPSEPRYSGLLVDSEDELNDHEYTPLDYEDHAVNRDETSNSITTNHVQNGELAESGTNDAEANGDDDNSINLLSLDKKGNISASEEEPIDYADASTDNNENVDELYEPIEGADKDGIYEAIDFAD